MKIVIAVCVAAVALFIYRVVNNYVKQINLKKTWSYLNYFERVFINGCVINNIRYKVLSDVSLLKNIEVFFIDKSFHPSGKIEGFGNCFSVGNNFILKKMFCCEENLGEEMVLISSIGESSARILSLVEFEKRKNQILSYEKKMKEKKDELSLLEEEIKSSSLYLEIKKMNILRRKTGFTSGETQEYEFLEEQLHDLVKSVLVKRPQKEKGAPEIIKLIDRFFIVWNVVPYFELIAEDYGIDLNQSIIIHDEKEVYWESAFIEVYHDGPHVDNSLLSPKNLVFLGENISRYFCNYIENYKWYEELREKFPKLQTLSIQAQDLGNHLRFLAANHNKISPYNGILSYNGFMWNYSLGNLDSYSVDALKKSIDYHDASKEVESSILKAQQQGDVLDYIKKLHREARDMREFYKCYAGMSPAG